MWDNAELNTFVREHKQLCVVASPPPVQQGLSCRYEVVGDVAIRVQNTDLRDPALGNLLLPVRLAQQVIGSEDGGRVVVLVLENHRLHY